MQKLRTMTNAESGKPATYGLTSVVQLKGVIVRIGHVSRGLIIHSKNDYNIGFLQFYQDFCLMQPGHRDFVERDSM
jgi:hypothetical protein